MLIRLRSNTRVADEHDDFVVELANSRLLQPGISVLALRKGRIERQAERKRERCRRRRPQGRRRLDLMSRFMFRLVCVGSVRFMAG